MEFIDLKRQYEHLKLLIQKNINTVLEHGQFILGPEVKTLESELAAYVRAKHCITVANGTDALMVAMLACDIKPGDEVITSPFTFIANAEMIALIGAVPVFVDIDPDTYNIDCKKIEEAITPKTKCIMPISLYGQCSDMDVINAIAKRHNLKVIEDAAQSFGATYKTNKSCGLSTIGCTSFFPSKPLGCYGDGGACFTNDDDLANKMRQLRAHGQEGRYNHKIVGMNSRLDTMQAAILLAKLTVFEDEVYQRIHLGQRYNYLLGSFVKTNTISDYNTCVYAQYTIEVSNRENVIARLKENNIPTAVHYPSPLHLQPALNYLGYVKGDFPFAENASSKVLSLPMHPYLTNSEQDRIVGDLLEIIQYHHEVFA